MNEKIEKDYLKLLFRNYRGKSPTKLQKHKPKITYNKKSQKQTDGWQFDITKHD